ncbi:MAG TPA: carbamate kinase [Chloroflexi bacterium]|nr:carbamate kinase [Chloroflexota bacterium]
MSERKLAAVAIGGNSLIKSKDKADVPHQFEAVRETCKHLAAMVEQGWDLVVTHGNGPQVGFILRRSELAAHEVHTVPLDIIGADTQGSIGYMLQQSLRNEFRRRGFEKPAVAVVTQVLVDANDPAFQNPSKGIGGYLTEEEAEKFRQEGWTVVDDAGRGLRRMIASPIPKRIIELDVISTLLKDGFLVIGVGGGGIPVVEDEQGLLRGAPPSVIDKDRATSLLASGINADLFLISTAVEKVAINFNKPDQKWLDHMTLDEARRYMEEGHFAPGSMKPKIEAVIAFLERGGKQALITNPENIARALAGETGTWITPD